ncbi:MAG: GrpB family protein [Boseongicola sp.]|nr:GrpB family protein [Boseongicola sp.]NNJ67290.1 GrpB family protein [Boseongicola sp.]
MSLLQPPDPSWSVSAKTEIETLMHQVEGLVEVHHIGSTSVPGLPAKPILDLMPILQTASLQAYAKDDFERMGYEWMDEFGLPGRAYARKSDPATGQRLVHAHSYVVGHPDIARHLAFRDALRSNAPLKAAYTSVKAACAARHPEGGATYGACKSDWIEKAENRALARIQETPK